MAKKTTSFMVTKEFKDVVEVENEAYMIQEVTTILKNRTI